ncbi:LysR family transcriptional regulator [Paenibacillus thailandensis]|uniref:LysR family transcriptional regulator n=1 Tax=Paenibacillus thailandensis TaxID=393250 RepID=A0ABW5R3D1_9BACL
MSILKMRLIVLIERLKKVTLVAQELGMKQPTVSFHMKKLEEEWGMPLFEHKTGKVLLTEAGRLLHRYALQIDRSYSEAAARMEKLRTSGKHTARIGCTPLAGAALLTASWFERISGNEGMMCEIAEGTHSELIAAMEEGRIDLVLTGLEPAESHYHREMLVETPIAAVVPAACAGEEGEPLSAMLHKGFTYIALDDPSVEDRLMAANAAEFAWLRQEMRLGAVAILLNAVRAGNAFTVMPAAAALSEKKAAEGTAVVPLPGKSALWQAYAVWPRNHWNPQLPLKLVQTLRRGAFAN